MALFLFFFVRLNSIYYLHPTRCSAVFCSQWQQFLVELLSVCPTNTHLFIPLNNLLRSPIIYLSGEVSAKAILCVASFSRTFSAFNRLDSCACGSARFVPCHSKLARNRGVWREQKHSSGDWISKNNHNDSVRQTALNVLLFLCFVSYCGIKMRFSALHACIFHLPFNLRLQQNSKLLYLTWIIRVRVEFGASHSHLPS